MDGQEEQVPWLERVEALISVLEGSTIAELELNEAGAEIIIRRQPQMMMVARSTQQIMVGQPGIAIIPGSTVKEDSSIAILAPLAGVYYASPSPDSAPFVAVGDIVQAGQVVALVEAMKVFNEVQAEISGRVVALVATNGNVVQKGDVLIRVEPI